MKKLQSVASGGRKPPVRKAQTGGLRPPLARFICLSGLVVVGLVLPLRAQAPGRDVTVPFELLKTKHLAAQVKLNGRGPYRVIFDTGAPILILNTKAARDSGVLPFNVEIPRDTPFNTVGQFPIQTLDMGPLRAEKLSALVMDHPAVASLSRTNGALEGIVGYSFFSRYRTTIDYRTRQLTFTPNGYEPEDVLHTLGDRLTGKKKLPPRLLDPAGVWGFVVSKEEDDEDAGVTVAEVRPGTPVVEAGLQAGDRLLTLDGRWTDSVADCYEATNHVKPGTAAVLVVRRKGKEMKLAVTPRAGL
jgi:hypothetical protein